MRASEPAGEILSEAKDLGVPIQPRLDMVEAAGVEPASEIHVSKETPCVVDSKGSHYALRIDKTRVTLVR
jgi:hypothetical protein